MPDFKNISVDFCIKVEVLLAANQLRPQHSLASGISKFANLNPHIHNSSSSYATLDHEIHFGYVPLFPFCKPVNWRCFGRWFLQLLPAAADAAAGALCKCLTLTRFAFGIFCLMTGLSNLHISIAGWLRADIFIERRPKLPIYRLECILAISVFVYPPSRGGQARLGPREGCVCPQILAEE